MKKITLILLFLLSSSAVFAGGEPVGRNENCLGDQRLEVLQVLNDGILGHLCPAFDDCYKGDLVYMYVNHSQNDYVDNQIIELPDTQCFGKNGTYSYINKRDDRKTIRRVKIISSAVAPIK